MTWLMLMVMFTSEPVQSGDTVKFGLPDVWFPTEAACNEKAAALSAGFTKNGVHVAYVCYEPPKQ